MTTYFIGDTHFGHSNIIKLENRPFASADEMDELMILNWNQKVKENDLVYHLGDVSYRTKKKTKDLVHKLNGNKICIRGNHDFPPHVMMKMGFMASMESCFIKLGKYEFYLGHEPFPMSAPNTWMLHGHVHSKWKFRPIDRRICLSVENWNYMPVSEKELIDLIEK